MVYKVIVQKGKVRWYYTLKNGSDIMLVSQKYYSKSNCKRAAKNFASTFSKATNCLVVINE